MWNQITNTGNESYREIWVNEILRELKTESNSQVLLDVGAGLQPYRNVAIDLGYNYVSHDFAQYSPDTAKSNGMQNNSWEYPFTDLVCDITKIPTGKYDLILCTEVLEHVPDPVSAFDTMFELLASEGLLVITVPIVSFMHQAPFYFSAGLSPQWFEHHSKNNKLEIKQLTIYGDYIDFMEQEILRTFHLLNYLRGFSRLRPLIKKYLRKRIDQSVLESGGFGVLYVAKK